MFPQSTEPFCTHMSTDKLRKSLEMGNFGNSIAAKRGLKGEYVGRGESRGVREECWEACLSSEQTGPRKGFSGPTLGEWLRAMSEGDGLHPGLLGPGVPTEPQYGHGGNCLWFACHS